MSEVWKEVPRYKGAYLISNLGNLKSTERYCYHNGKPWLVKERLLSKVIGHNGYIEYQITYNKKHRSEKAHRLVAEAFLPNPNNKPFINHIDGNKQNNCVENLEWCTNQENILHAYHHRLIKRCKKIAQYDLQMNLIKIWETTGDIERAGIAIKRHIHEACKGKRKQHHGYIWRYSDAE